MIFYAARFICRHLQKRFVFVKTVLNFPNWKKQTPLSLGWGFSFFTPSGSIDTLKRLINIGCDVFRFYDGRHILIYTTDTDTFFIITLHLDNLLKPIFDTYILFPPSKNVLFFFFCTFLKLINQPIGACASRKILKSCTRPSVRRDGDDDIWSAGIDHWCFDDAIWKDAAA